MKHFIGSFVNKIDAKGRVSVPASFRTLMQSKGQNAVALYPSVTAECLEGCGLDRIEAMVDSLEDTPVPSVEDDSIAYTIFGMARETAFDATGRIVLPADFMAHANLTDRAAFVGKGRTFQIWEPDALDKVQTELVSAMRNAREKARAGEGDGSAR